MNKNFISILVTNYNKGKYIVKSINSCINQNFRNKEIIIFDDCSNDNSVDFLKKKKGITVYFNKKKKLKSGLLNKINGTYHVFKKSKGKVIFLLDGDDYFKKNKINYIFNLFDKNKDLNFIQDRAYLRRKKQKMFLKKKKFSYSIWPSFYPTSCIAIRREFLIDFFKFSEMNKFPNLEIDARLSIYAFLNDQFNLLKKSFTVYNFDNFGITSNYKKFTLNWWKKRFEGFEYMKILMKKMNLKFVPSLDYYLTNLINSFIKKNI